MTRVCDFCVNDNHDETKHKLEFLMYNGKPLTMQVEFVLWFLSIPFGTCALWKRIFRIRPGDSSPVMERLPSLHHATSNATADFAFSQTNPQMSRFWPKGANNQSSNMTLLETETKGTFYQEGKKMTWVSLLLHYILRSPFEVLPPDPFVELVSLTRGNIDLCRVLAYGRAVALSVPSYFLIRFLHLYDLDLWFEIFLRLVRTFPQEGPLFVSVLLFAGFFVFLALRSIQFAFEYWTQEDLWFRELELGKYSRIWKDSQLWQDHHRSRNKVGQ